MSKYTPRSRKYWELCRVVKREEPNCWLCYEPIDPLLRYPDPHSFSNDHIISPKVRPDLAEVRSNMRASHLVCNQRRGDRPPSPIPSILYVEDF